LQICTLSHNNTSTSAINTLSLHDALPILEVGAHTRSHPHLTQCNDTQLHDELEGGKAALEDVLGAVVTQFCYPYGYLDERVVAADRKSTRLNSSHVSISYAVFCLKKKIRQ